MTTANEETWRVFCAVDLPPTIRERIANYSGELRSALPDVRASWSRADNIHLTLKFLSAIPVHRVAAFSSAATRAAKRYSAFTIAIGGAGTFPPHGAPRVLWIGISDDSGQLDLLQHALEEECARAGFEKENRPYNPHLTIARLRGRDGARELGQAHKDRGFAPIELRVSELTVIRSQLSSKGSRYTVISRHELSCNP